MEESSVIATARIIVFAFKWTSPKHCASSPVTRIDKCSPPLPPLLLPPFSHYFILLLYTVSQLDHNYHFRSRACHCSHCHQPAIANFISATERKIQNIFFWKEKRNVDINYYDLFAFVTNSGKTYRITILRNEILLYHNLSNDVLI